MNCQLEGLPFERLMAFIVALGRDVEIVVRAGKADQPARLTVLEAA